MQKENNSPIHVALIPDGNRRWARLRGLAPWEGHEEGARSFEKIVKRAFDMKIKYLSFWGLSLDNLTKRPFREKQALLKIFEKYFTKLIKNEDVHKNKVRINVIGRWEKQFPNHLKNVISE